MRKLATIERGAFCVLVAILVIGGTALLCLALRLALLGELA